MGVDVRIGGRVLRVDFQDIEAMVHNARRRGLAEAQAEHEVALQQARREAWDEGRAVGVDDGRGELLLRIDRQFGEVVRVEIKMNNEMLERLEGDERKVPKRDLAERVRQLTLLLERLVEAHHYGFVEGPPF